MPTMSGPEQLFCRSAPWSAWTRKVVLPWALQGVHPEGDVLEIGAGSGSMAAGILDTHPQARLTLTDIDPKMVGSAHNRFTAQPWVTVQEADATRLPFADASFDHVVSFLMLHHVVQWEQALSEMRRVLRPTGRLIGYDLTATTLARLVHLLDRSPHRLITLKDLEAGIASAGFDRVEVRTDFAGHVMRFNARQGTTQPS